MRCAKASGALAPYCWKRHVSVLSWCWVRCLESWIKGSKIINNHESRRYFRTLKASNHTIACAVRTSFTDANQFSIVSRIPAQPLVEKLQRKMYRRCQDQDSPSRIQNQSLNLNGHLQWECQNVRRSQSYLFFPFLPWCLAWFNKQAPGRWALSWTSSLMIARGTFSADTRPTNQGRWPGTCLWVAASLNGE